jgi:site-specific recombinase XerD
MTTPDALTNGEEAALRRHLVLADVLNRLRDWTLAYYRRSHHAHYHPLAPTALLLGLDAGLRVREIARLSWYDVVLGAAGPGALRISPANSKTGESRTIPLSADLRRHLEILRGTNTATLDYSKPLYVLTHRLQANPPTTRTLQRWISQVAVQAIGRHIHPHTLRHTFATRLLQVTDVRTVQQLLGHRCLASTQVYTHVDPDGLAAAVQARTAVCTRGDHSLSGLTNPAGQTRPD